MDKNPIFRIISIILGRSGRNPRETDVKVFSRDLDQFSQGWNGVSTDNSIIQIGEKTDIQFYAENDTI